MLTIVIIIIIDNIIIDFIEIIVVEEIIVIMVGIGIMEFVKITLNPGIISIMNIVVKFGGIVMHLIKPNIKAIGAGMNFSK